MALCSLCHDIPFASLADPPPYSGFFRVNDNSEMPVLSYLPNSADAAPADPLGFPWHTDLDALTLSAGSCAFCGIIQDGVKTWLDHLEAAQKNASFMEFSSDLHKAPRGQRLWVTKRYSGAPGLLVFVRHPLGNNSIYLLTGVSFATENPPAGALKLRPMDLDSGSPHSLGIAASFLLTCDRDHESCVGGESPLPSRLLDLGEAGDVIKLVDTKGQVGEYACLSYCWGPAPHFTTSRESMEARQAGIRLTDLPKTYLDAITITRHLRLRYLWIDALCICQDDSEDWARESARMINIYSGAHLVIAANRASDNSQGCFHIRAPRRTGIMDLPGYASDVHVQSIFNSDVLDWGNGSFSSDPLSMRAWALQERLLARRILHYNERQICFECNCGMVSEDGYFQASRYLDISHLQSTTEERTSITEPASKSYQKLWGRVIWEYGRRKFTRPTDKFPALSGLAKIFEKRLQAQYVAGLWSMDMMNGLAWQGLGDRKPQAVSPDQYIGPSWSWASYAGIAATGVSEGWRTTAEIIDWEVRLKTEANPHGEIRSAWLRLRGPIASLVQAKRETTDHEIRLQRAGHTPLPRLHTRYSDSEEGNFVTFDYEENKKPGIWKKLDLYVLVLGGYPPKDKRSRVGESSEEIEGVDQRKEDEVENESHFGLVITRVDGEKPESGMKRMGWTYLSGPEGEKLKGDPSNWKTVTLF
ncbi:HET-domain-containing protein [Xylariaceae sp. AK1471]|nr:HET-domain-containing protein [Xylariaceae sp. AK1471]